MSITKPKPSPNGANSGNASQEPPTYRINPEVEIKIDAHIKENPKYWTYLQAMPRDRLERTVVLDEVRQLERQQRMREGMMKRINDDPKLKSAYEILVKDVPEDLRFSLTDADGKDAYPIVGTSWMVLYVKQPAEKADKLPRRRAIG